MINPNSDTPADTTNRGWAVTFSGMGINLALGILYADLAVIELQSPFHIHQAHVIGGERREGIDQCLVGLYPALAGKIGNYALRD